MKSVTVGLLVILVVVAVIHGTSGQCTSTQFRCTSGQCVLSSLRCNGIMTCSDGSDERNCISCQSGAFRCSNGQCISILDRCDGSRDCTDGSDETGCCSSTQFECTSGLCISSSSRCNGIRTCSDGSDERICSSCRSGAFRCSNFQCILSFYRCDGIQHCTDGSDETGCTSCRSGAFRCSNGQCVLSSRQCDGNQDCIDGSDETGCASCRNRAFRCSNGQCILSSRQCDGNQDCIDGSDEAGCVNITFQQLASFEPPVPPGPDSVVSATNLSCTVANEGSFRWQWTLPPGITFAQMWLTNGTMTSIVQISQISAANTGTYICQASYNVSEVSNTTSAESTIFIQLNRRLVSSPSISVTTESHSAALSCEVYGYLPVQLPTIVWSFGGDQLTNDSVYTITIEGGSHMIQNGGDSPRSSIRSVLTINHPNKTHEGTYFCSASSSTVNVTLQVMNAVLHPVTDRSPSPNIGLSVGLPIGFLLIVSVPVAIVVIIIVFRKQILRKKNKQAIAVNLYESLEHPQLPPTSTFEHKVVGSPQQPSHMDTIITDVNEAYASSTKIQSN